MRKLTIVDFYNLAYPEPNTGCWIWGGSINQQGYGAFGSSKTQDHYLAHRFSYAAHNGEIGKLCVCHRCDVRCCVNPDHLFLGTLQENNKDRHDKGRSNAPYGNQHPFVKIKDEQIDIIRKLYVPRKYSTWKLAKEFNVSQRTIMHCLHTRKISK